jgi:glutamyl-tRNA reductase
VHILTLGLNHTTAPVEIREKLALPETDQQSALVQLVERYGLHEAAILSTCNRSEIYVAGEDIGALEGCRRYLSEVQGVDVHQFKPYFYELSDGDAAQHLFSVACGIDSLVIGESQILKQVRQALEFAQHNGSAHLLINELFQRSLRVGKRARTETDIGRGRLSISTAAVELASQIFDSLEGRHALLLGAGEMIELTAQYLMDSGIARFFVANRTYERGAQLARRFSGEALPFDEFTSCMEDIDIVISSTAAPDFVLQEKALRQVMRRRRGRPLFLIDIAVPRDIDPKARDIDNVFLFDIDDLKQVVEANRSEREGEILQVQKVIEEELGDFLHWFNSLGTGPLIKALRQHAQDLSQVELDRWTGKLAHLPEQDRQLIESILKGYANKLLHQPLVQLREFANAEDGYIRLDTVRRLFGLDAGEDAESR